MTRCVGEALPYQSESSPNEDAIVELWLMKRIDMAKPQQAGCHLFTAPVNNSKSVKIIFFEERVQ